MFNCKWLPDLEPYTSSKEWKEYEDFIYGIFSVSRHIQILRIKELKLDIIL